MHVGLLGCVCTVGVQVSDEARKKHWIFYSCIQSSCALPDAGAWNRTQGSSARAVSVLTIESPLQPCTLFQITCYLLCGTEQVVRVDSQCLQTEPLHKLHRLPPPQGIPDLPCLTLQVILFCPPPWCSVPQKAGSLHRINELLSMSFWLDVANGRQWEETESRGRRQEEIVIPLAPILAGHSCVWLQFSSDVAIPARWSLHQLRF